MNITPKELIPDKEWIIKNGDTKIGSLMKSKKGYFFSKNGQKILIKNPKDYGIELPENKITSTITIGSSFKIYDFPCGSKPFEPVYNLQKKLPIFTKSSKSKSHFCAGYYIIKFRKGWVKSFCPKLITLERYHYLGPFKTEQEMKHQLNLMNKS